MGTFGTGPLDNDTALDVKDTLLTLRGPGAGVGFLMAVADHLVHDAPDDLHAAHQAAVGVCAVVADVVAGEYHYTRPPDPDDPEDFRLELVPEVPVALLASCTAAISRALGLLDHPDMPDWDSERSAREHRVELEELEERLYGAARGVPGHPLHGLTPDT